MSPPRRNQGGLKIAAAIRFFGNPAWPGQPSTSVMTATWDASDVIQWLAVSLHRRGTEAQLPAQIHGTGHPNMKDLLTRIACFAVLTLIAWTPAATAQQIRPNAITSSAAAGGVVDPKALSDTSNFVIGVGDILSISFWREQTMSGVPSCGLTERSRFRF